MDKYLRPDQARKQEKELNGDKESQKIKCGALLRRCKKCELKFGSAEETECGFCGTPRERCSSWAIIGSKLCRRHGGHGGKKIKVGEDGLGLSGYSAKEKSTIKKNVINMRQKFEELGAKMIALIERIENSINVSDIDGSVKLLKACSDIYRNLTGYMKLLATEKYIEKIPDNLQKRIGIQINVAINRSYAQALNSIFEILKDENVIENIKQALPEHLKIAYNEQDTYFKSLSEIAKIKFPDIEIVDGNNTRN